MAQLTPEQQTIVDTAKDLMEKVLDRITRSTVQYGSNYVLADIVNETEEEMLDIIGWPLLEVVRMRQLFSNNLKQFDEHYLNKFFNLQKSEYLLYLKEKINEELAKRQ